MSWKPASYPAQPITQLVFVQPHLLHALQRIVADEPDWRELDRNYYRPRLFNYLDHTFRRCLDNEQVLTYNQQYLVFCTGLLTPTQELVYCLCGPNPQPVKNRIYRIQGFLSAFQLTGTYMERFLDLPPVPVQLKPRPAKYPPIQPFDAKIQLQVDRIDISHLLRDGKTDELLPRLPKTWQKDPDQPEFLAQLKAHMLAAIVHTFEEPRPVSSFCRGLNEMQFLLPINLSEPEESSVTAEAAITVRRVWLKGAEGPTYEVTTLLPLELARSNARLLGPVTESWLSGKFVEMPVLKKNWRSEQKNWRDRS